MSTAKDESDARQPRAEDVTVDCLAEPITADSSLAAFQVQDTIDAVVGRPGSGKGASAAVPGFEILGELGRGGMGVVYKARQVSLGRIVALKMILAGGHAGEAQLVRFRTEAQAVAQLQHPNIVQIHEVGDHDGLPFFCLEYCPGGSLDRKLQGAPQAPRKAAELSEILARAMHAAHERHIIHRDLKPSNILLSEDGSPKITDFGLAKKLDAGTETAGGASSVTQSGTIIGTPSYMAPEQASGQAKNLGPPADIYALGVILYELLTGRPPFRAETPVDTLVQVISQEPVPPTKLNAKVPRDLETICLKCLHKEPGRRYVTAGELADDLRRFLAGEAIQARPVGVIERTWRWVKRYPAKAALFVMSLLLVIGGSSAAVWIHGEQARQDAERKQHEAERKAEKAQQDAKQAQRAADLSARRSNLRKAVEDAEQRRQILDAQLADMKSVNDVLSDVGKWESSLKEIETLARTAELAAGEEDLVDDDLADRLRKLAAGLKSDRRQLQTMKDFDEARLEAGKAVAGMLTNKAAADAYEKILARAGIDVLKGDLDMMVSRMQASPLRFVYLAMLDDWCALAGKKVVLTRLFALANKVDPDPWRTRVRDLEVWQNTARLKEAIALTNVAEQSPHILRALARRLKDKGEFGEATRLMRQARDVHPRDFWVHFVLGTLTEDSLEAEGSYRAALTLRPRASAAHNNLAVALSRRDLHVEALVHYQKAVDLNPMDVGNLTNLAIGLARLKRYDEAEKMCRAVLQTTNFAAAHNALAGVLDKRGKFAEAVPHWQKAVELAPWSVNFHYNLAQAMRRTKRFKEANEHYLEAIRLETRSGEDRALAHEGLGMVFLDVKEPAKAAEHFLEAVKTLPRDPRAHDNLGVAYRALGDLVMARKEFLKALDIDPKFADAHQGLASIAFDKRDWDTAMVHARLSLKLDPDNPEYLGGLGVLLREKEDFDAAIPAMKRAVELKPEKNAFRANLASALFHDGDLAGSREIWKACFDAAPAGDPLRGQADKQLKNIDLLLTNEGRLSDIKAGKVVALQQKDILFFAEYCRKIGRRHATAVHFFNDAIGHDPSVALDPQKEVVLHLAGSAVLAAAGQAADAADLDEAARSKLRRHALYMLRIDLAMGRKLVGSEKAREVAQVIDKLHAWKSYRQLAGVRDAAEVAALSFEDRDSWHKFWADVEELLDDIGRSYLTLTVNAALTERDTVQTHTVKLVAGKEYVIELRSRPCNTVLRLEDMSGKVLAENDDIGPKNLNSRVIFAPTATGPYRIVAGSFKNLDTGAYTLTIREFPGNLR